MPRRHRVANPNPPPQRQQQSQLTEQNDSSNQSKSDSSQPVSNAVRSARQSITTNVLSTSTNTSLSSLFDSNVRSIHFKLVSDGSSGVGNAIQFELTSTMVALRIPPESFKKYADHLSVEFNAGLKVRPLNITDNLRIVLFIVGKMNSSDNKFFAGFGLNQSISPQALKDSKFGPISLARFKECSMRVVNSFDGLTQQTTGFDDTVMYLSNERLIDALVFSELTVHQQPCFFQWDWQQPNKREMVATTQSIKCLTDRQVQWEAFLQDMNRRIARFLSKYPIKHVTNQNASAIVLSNHQCELMITIRFARPTVQPTLRMVQHLSLYVLAVIKCARYDQLEHHPNREYAHMILYEMDQRSHLVFGPSQ